MSPLPGDWPAEAREVVRSHARRLIGAMAEPWAVFDVLAQEAVTAALRELDAMGDRLDELADDGWWARFEGGQLEAEVLAALRHAYDKAASPEV